MKKLKAKSLKSNPRNPRVIKDAKFEKLKDSISDFSAMMSLRPIVLDDDGFVIGGNMRMKACIDLGWEEIPTEVFTSEMWEENELKLPIEERKTYEERCDEFIIKDNSSFGEWDWDVLANKWDSTELNTWGVDVWNNTDDMFDTFEVDTDKEEGNLASDNEYSKFDIVLLHENKGRFVETLNKIKSDKSFETQEEALMFLIEMYYVSK